MLFFTLKSSWCEVAILAAGNPRIAEYGKATQIKKGQRPPGGGRKRSLIKQFAIESDLSPEDISRAINLIIDMTEAELTDLSKDSSRPIILRGFAGAVLAELKKHGIQNIMLLLDRSFGKPKGEATPVEIRPIVFEKELDDEGSAKS
jgi:hypothetical protein